MAYRDDLQAALARNHDLEGQVRELRRALDKPSAPAAPVAPRPRKPGRTARPRAPRRGIVFVRPARYFPLAPMAVRWVGIVREWLARWVPRPRLPRLGTSDIVLLDLLRWPVLALWVPVSLLGQSLVLVAGLLWYALTIPLLAVTTVVASILALPVIAALSVRHTQPNKPVVGLQWGVSVTDEAALSLYSASILICPFLLTLAVLVSGC